MNTLSESFDRFFRGLIYTLLGLSLLALMPAGCTFDGSGLDEVRCSSDDDCPNGATCVGQYCVGGTLDIDRDARQPADTVEPDARQPADVAPSDVTEPADIKEDAGHDADTKEPDIIPSPTCTDGRKNGQETDVDCGGPDCDACGNQASCLEDRDCASEYCHNGLCQVPSCTDGLLNGDETDVDCGGSACPRCPVDKLCLLDSDCESDMAQGWGQCQFPAVEDSCVNEGVRTQLVTEFFCDASSGRCQSRERTDTDTDTCVRDTTGEQCGAVTHGAWGDCEFDPNNICGSQGQKTREVYTPSCTQERCEPVTTIETAACSRNTDGVVCGDTDEGAWGACDYASSCAAGGTRTRQVTNHICGGGSCNDITTSQTDTSGCARDTDGDGCSEISGGICSGGSCVECTSHDHCASNQQYPYCHESQCVECSDNSHCDGQYVGCKLDVLQCVQRCRPNNESDCNSVPGTSCQGGWCLP